MIVSLDCLAHADGGFGFYKQFIIYLCVPFLCIVFAVLAYLAAMGKDAALRLYRRVFAARKLKRSRSVEDPKSPSSSGAPLLAPPSPSADPDRDSTVGPSSPPPIANGGAPALLDDLDDDIAPAVAIASTGAATHVHTLLPAPSRDDSLSSPASPSPRSPASPAVYVAGGGDDEDRGKGKKMKKAVRTSSGALVPTLPSLVGVVAAASAAGGGPKQRKKNMRLSIGEAPAPLNGGGTIAASKKSSGSSAQKGGWTVRGEKYTPRPMDYALVSLIVCLYTIQPAVANIVLNAFNCVTVGGRRFLRQDLGQACSGPDWNLYTLSLGVPALIFYIWFLPLLPFFIMWVKRRELGRPHLRVRFAFLARGFRPEYIYFEAFNLVKKQLVIFIAVFLSQKIMVQGLLALGLLVVANVYLARAQPYEHRELNALDVAQATVVSLTVFGGLFFGTNTLEEGQNVIIAIVLLAMNVAFLGLWGWLFAREMIRIAREQKHLGAAINYVALATARFKSRVQERARSFISPPASRVASALLSAASARSARVAAEPSPSSRSLGLSRSRSPRGGLVAGPSARKYAAPDEDEEDAPARAGAATAAHMGGAEPEFVTLGGHSTCTAAAATARRAGRAAGPRPPSFSGCSWAPASRPAFGEAGDPEAHGDAVVPFPRSPTRGGADRSGGAGVGRRPAGPPPLHHRSRHRDDPTLALEEEDA
eukprot:tig00021137_g18990.t1